MQYINKKKAMEYLMGNEYIFNKVKTSFLANNCNYAKVYNDLTDTCDIKKTYYYIHSIKGISLNLGAELLFEACNEALEELKKELWRKDLIDNFFKTLRFTFYELTLL